MSSVEPDIRLLTADQVGAAKAIAGLLRDGLIVPLVGAGLSRRAGLPTWEELGENLIRAWHQSEPDPARRALDPDTYVRLIHWLFGADHLAFTSYLRHRVTSADNPAAGSAAFSALVYKALYGAYPDTTPRPDDVHRHLVALFADHPRQLWTTNYDDLLEQAAQSLGLAPLSLHLTDHRAGRGLLVHHLHGYLPPAPPNQEPSFFPVVLAEDDYHAVAANQVDAAWIDHAFYQLFETRHVLILGMSLSDRNLRRVLATLPPARSSGPAVARHYALMKMVTPGDLAQERFDEAVRESAAHAACALRAHHWSDYGIEVIDLDHHGLLLPFLVRLRYEAHAGTPGGLWAAAAERVARALRPWEQTQQRRGLALLRQIGPALAEDFGLAAPEHVDVGLFLLAQEPRELELVMRVGASPPAQPRGRTFSVDPDAPTGVAGCVFVSGSGMIVNHDDAYHDYGGVPPVAGESAPYATIISVPVVDWPSGGLPVGVLYVTVRSLDAALLQRPAGAVLDWLSQAGRSLLDELLERTTP